MAAMIHSKYGYEPPEWVQADARLDKWYKDKKRFLIHKFRSDVMAAMIHSKYGYEPPEWVQADARLDKWYKDKK
ncbi:hypothetical protein, partial [Lactiplantibacillus plantarum]|uniref:hypothetical protein n=1 Tax=Lactiplantibacillus plantarum TaxID=1590 RepID=UPI0016511914